MALKFLDKRIIGAIIVDAFQQQLNTEMDPANGQWFTNGPGNNGGLYGSLVDSLASALVFLPNEVVLTPNKLAAATAVADNRNGLTPKQTLALTYSRADTATTSHTTTNALKVGIGVDIKAKAEFLGNGVEVTTKISTEYSYSWSDTVTSASSETKQFALSVPTDIPTGKVFQVVLTCDKTDLKAPYYADIIISGKATANFASPVNGKTTWVIDAGTLCEWINKFGSAGDESSKYMRDPANPTQGFIRLRGNLTSAITANFVVNTYDITDSYNATGKPVIETNQTFAPNELDRLNQKLIEKKGVS